MINNIAITKSKAIYTDKFQLKGKNFPQNVNVVDSFLDGTETGYKYTCELMYDQLFTTEDIAYFNHIALKEGKNGVIIASGTSEWSGAGVHSPHTKPDYTLKVPFFTCINILSGKMANKLGWHDYMTTDATACISGYKAFLEAELILNAGIVDRVLVIGIDDQINPVVLEMFGLLDASISPLREESGALPSAFDDENYGFRLGHGIGYILLENKKSLKETNNKPLAYLDKTVLRGEKLSNPFGQDPSGDGYSRVMKEVLEETSFTTDDISFIKTHGTGSKSNNIAESNGIRSVFGENFIATSYKSEIGHTLGSNAIVELDIALKDAAKGIVRGIKNRTKEDHQFLSYDKEMKVEKILMLGSGMGNVYGSSIISINHES
jgi:3-oxoacyl-(acyl-carrier-protein) synthase